MDNVKLYIKTLGIFYISLDSSISIVIDGTKEIILLNIQKKKERYFLFLNENVPPHCLG